MKTNRVIGLSLVLVVLMAVVAAAALASSDTPDVVDDIVDEPVAQARDLAMQCMLDNYPDGLGVPLVPHPDHWDTEYLTPEGWCGSSTWQFTQDGWTVTVQYPIVLEPIYTVTVDYVTPSVPDFTATVQNGEVIGFEFA